MAEKPGNRILNVDDDDGGRYAITRVLTRSGFEVTEAATGMEALKLLKERPDLVLLDVNLPDINGLEVCRRIKTDPSTASIPVVHLSATHVETEARVKGLEGGADSYLVHPVDSKELVATINALLRLKRAEDALRESEVKYRTLVETTDTGYLITDFEGKVIDANSEYVRLSGHTNLEQILGRSVIEWTSEKDRERNAAEGEKCTRQDSARNLEIDYVDKQGRVTPVEINASVVVSGQLCQIVSLCRDITERKRAEEERFKLEQKLQQAQKAASLGRMAGAIAHHFNNLLGIVMGNLELAMFELPEGPGPRPTIREAMAACRRAADVSQLMLAYLGQSIGKRAPFELSELCRQALPELTASLPERVRLRTEFPDDGPIIRGDAAQVRQVLINLVANAAEAMADRQGEVGVAIHITQSADMRALNFYPTEWKLKEEKYACLSVSDTGAGMDRETMDKIFDPFFSTKFVGRGLGLAVVLGAAKAHEGAVTVESSPGRGSSFRVFLPVSEVELPLLGKARGVDTVPPKDRGLVLLVEDEPMLRGMAQAMLTRLGYEAVTAADGVEALEMFREQQDRIQCVLLDHTMPRMGGWETLTALRTLRPDLPVVLASGYDEARAMGVEHPERPQGFLHKPYAMAGLDAALQAAVSGAKRTEQKGD